MRLRNCLFLLLLLPTTVFADRIKLEHYSDDQGLSQNSVRHIVQDNTGLLWIGTFLGLNSFDGNTFTAYTSETSKHNSLENNDITALVMDSVANQLWIGTRKGLTCLDLKKQEFTTFLHNENDSNSLPDNEVRALFYDKFNRMWVGTKDSGLCILNRKTNAFSRVDIDGFNYVKSIYEDSYGCLWIGSNGTGGVAQIRFNKDGSVNKIKTYTLTIPGSTEINPYVNFIYQDRKSDIFVGTREGLYKLNKLEDKFYNLWIPDASVRNILGPYFNCVAQSPQGKYWLGTLGGLIVCDHLEDITTGNYRWYYSDLSDNSSLVDNSVSSLFFDKSGVLWIGTENGLDKFDRYKNQFKNIRNISYLINNKIPRISGLAETYDNHIIVSTHDNGLFIGKNNKFSVLSQPNKSIASIYTPDGKVFYCGLWNGNIMIYNYPKNSYRTLDLGLGETLTLAFVKLKDGTIFIGSHGNKAVLLNPHTLKYKTILPAYFSKVISNQSVSDSTGMIWIATESGVVRYNPYDNKVRTYSESKSPDGVLFHDIAKDIAIDRNGTIWVATTTGLCYYKPSEDIFIHINSPEELRDEWITDIRFRKNNEMWLNFNNNKVGKYDIKTKQLNVYRINSGNRLDIFSNRGFLLFNDSLIYVPGKEGIIYFPTNITNVYKTAGLPFISEVKIHGKVIHPGDTINGHVIVKENINYSRKMVLDYSNRNFSLSFSSPSYVDVKLNKFQFMLEGFDNSWINANNNSRNIQYTNLYPGKYVFKIKTQNSNGIWSPVSSYEIRIKPPFWLTYKSLLLYLVVLVLTFYLIRSQTKKRILLKQELVLEKVKRERDDKLNNEKLRFFTNISHELRTPISLILGPVKHLLEENNLTDVQRNKAELILKNSNRLMYLINQLLDFRKAQNGEFKLKVIQTEILRPTRNAFNSFKGLALEKQISYNFTCERGEVIGWIDVDKYEKILYNLLSNAIKFTNKYGSIDLFVDVKDDESQHLIVEISDDGIGIPRESQTKIFKRFYQTEQNKIENTGSGIGLSLVDSLIKVHKAKIFVKSEPGAGSTFTIEIPINKDNYDASERFDVQKDFIDESPGKAKKIVQTTDIKKKILVIEDNKELRQFINEYLSDTYKVYEAENGEQGLQLCRQIKPILCVSDIKMPVMDGYKFCVNLKKDTSISHIPVILLTALSDNENVMTGYKLGADGYITKPFDPALLKIRIQNIIKSRIELKTKFSGEIESNIAVLSHSPVDEEFITQLSNIIEENINNPDLKVDMLCAEMGISSSKLYRKIKELTDLSPNEFIRTLRLKKSAQLLKTRKYNVSEVSYLVGFNDPLYFSRCFKKQFGFSPRKYL